MKTWKHRSAQTTSSWDWDNRCFRVELNSEFLTIWHSNYFHFFSASILFYSEVWKAHPVIKHLGMGCSFFSMISGKSSCTHGTFHDQISTTTEWFIFFTVHVKVCQFDSGSTGPLNLWKPAPNTDVSTVSPTTLLHILNSSVTDAFWFVRHEERDSSSRSLVLHAGLSLVFC